MNQDSCIRAAVIFGHGRLHTGIIVEPASGHKFDPSDTRKLNEFRDKIW